MPFTSKSLPAPVPSDSHVWLFVLNVILGSIVTVPLLELSAMPMKGVGPMPFSVNVVVPEIVKAPDRVLSNSSSPRVTLAPAGWLRVLFLNSATAVVPFGSAAPVQLPPAPPVAQAVLAVPLHTVFAPRSDVGKPSKSNAATKAPFANNELAEADDKRRARLE